MSNLRLLNETTTDGTVSSIQVNDVFSADFDIYKITTDLSNETNSPKGINMRLINSSGSVITSSNYDRAISEMYAAQAFVQSRTSNASYFNQAFGLLKYPPEAGVGVSYIFNPFSSSAFTTMINHNFSTWSGNKASLKSIFILKQLSSCTGFQAYLSSTNFHSTSVIKTYGLRID